MHEPTMSKRRLVLKMLGGAPMLPLGAVGAATLLAGCRAGADGARAAARGAGPRGDFAAAAFTSMAAPSLDAPEKMAVTTVESTLEVSFSDGGRQTFQLRYEPFFMTGDSVPDGQGATLVAGGYLDIHGRPIMDSSVPGKARQFFSDCPDGMSLLALPSARVPGVKGNTVFAVVQFEYASHNQKGESMYGLLPSPIAVLTLAQDPATGRLALVKYSPVDTAPAHGLWITCGASLSPWNTHLASEEYEPDATTARASAQFQGFSRNLYGDAAKANPYHYGHLPEVVVHPDGTGTIRKHYCLGRISHELIQVMPDQRTCLMGDDATNGGLFMFVADRKADLSAGTLYVAKWRQTSGEGPGAGTLG